ncbi:MAG: WecB/TagA/CpsF family glycosyltransferase, partial [Candidatus Omnitrophica bacterium]|nr:WecB/TagA/CpsF family glycosyltransferase [Candidatus Omnitrophota bacterium]
KYFVAVGRFVPEKGFHDLISAYATLNTKGWKLAIVGDADHEDSYSRKLRAQAAVVEGVVMTGFQSGDALKELYSNAGVFVLPSYYEGLPIVLLEALSYGLNCLVSDIPANREVPLSQERYVRPGSVKEWALKMVFMMNISLTADARAAQLKLIRDNYNWPLIASKTMQAYSEFMPPAIVNICGVNIHNLFFREVLEHIEKSIILRMPVSVVTPNVDHIVKLQNDLEFKKVYERAALVLVDGMPILWAARFLGTPLREKVSGSDLFPKVCEMASAKGWTVFFMGGREGAASKAAETFRKSYPGIKVVGTYCPPMGFEKDEFENQRIVKMIKEKRPDILFVGVGAPKQEKWIDKFKDQCQVPVSIGVGVSFEFVAGIVKRAPLWMQNAGLEWFWRLMMEPQRLWRRYLVEDAVFFSLVLNQKLSFLKNSKSALKVRAILYVAFIISLLTISVLLLPIERLQYLFVQDHFFDYQHMICAFIAAFFFSLKYLTPKNRNAFFLLLSLVACYLFLEEVFKLWLGFQLTEMRRVFYTFYILYFMIIPLFNRYIKQAAAFFQMIRLPVSPILFGVLAFIDFAVLWVMNGHHIWWRGVISTEFAESQFNFLLMSLSIWFFFDSNQDDHLA